MAENIAAVLHGPCDLRIEKWPMPEINDYEVLIKIDCCGICGSDLKMYSAGRCGADRLTEPIVLGHEGAGFVIKVGSKVSSLAAGDRVAIEPTQPCRACEFCRQGRYNLCPEPRYCSTVGAPGSLCHYYKHVADFCHKIPDNLSMEEGAAVQPLAITIHACGRAGIKVGTTLLVLGAGPIGVLCAMTARAMGATKILITDVVESRLETAKKLGADFTLLIRKEYSDQQVVDKIREMLGTSPNVTMDACGFASAQRVAMMVTRSGGTVVVVGIGADTVEVPLTGALLREVDVRGAFRLLNSYPQALAAVSSGAIDLKSFITHRFPLEKAREAMEYAKTGEPMKIIIHM
ncbi:sorbitol dehydrogenase-like isoform X1 [Maniola jurtina]|uniref:sorbitol dehydrogenase-like isoform X1 n=2 Tax=Maniola jurtina TaxID=191418 RepID=UPI001E689CCB|nr:sorbitol dehydrogenase-like isoform X1 [Maniola jurtina]